ncbi:hypothetical protein BAE44_0024633 [Dichanthelium oligosanthes]|uniref:Disease resistance R13L4/SHOC-2-like LRR domain-containing protein n=1 Tax=Dichanthelium oligosanthes TaxID=888268 RepID=A0A1E5UNF1_9POAL|nr:hypothetical protein BAE44_0024633 [Dichanthelium oligosanthes]
MGKLSALHTMGVVNINSPARGEAFLEDLKSLTQLHKLGVCGVNQRNIHEFRSAISGHGHLESLSVQLDKGSQAGCLDVMIFKPPENLRSLKLYGLAGKLPAWIKGLLNLRKLNLQMTTILAQEEIDVLGGLPKLQILCLCLKEFQDGGKLRFRTGFRDISVLEIACNSKLKVLAFDGRDKMECVEVLKIHCCNNVSAGSANFWAREGTTTRTQGSLA